MKNSQQIKLVEGHFTAEEAFDILLSLINSKINFQAMKNLTSKELHGKSNEYSCRRMQELQEERRKLESFIQRPGSDLPNIRIHSTIEVTIEHAEPIGELTEHQ